MRRILFNKMLLAGMLMLTMVACKKDDDEVPANVIEDATGLKLDLTWTLTDGSTATSFVDIDVYVYRSSDLSTEIAYGTQTSTFEQVNLTNAILTTDGDYTVTVDYYDLNKNGNWTLTVNGLSVSKPYTIANRAFTTAEDGQEKQVLKISKSGNKYTLTNL
ncbi:MAG TPA: hypothetical protein VFZ78_01090 [Flavisolibacter sp.]